MALLKEMLQANPTLYQGISAEVLCSPVNDEADPANSLLSRLANKVEGIALLTDLLQRNPGVIQGITAEALCREYGKKKNTPFASMMKTAEGQAVVARLVEGNRDLMQHPPIAEGFRQITLKRRAESPIAAHAQMFSVATVQGTDDDDPSTQPAKKRK